MGLILLIDDHDDSRRLAERLLHNWGHQTLQTDSAEAGLALLVTEKPDLIIVDGKMPGMNGVEFIRQAKTNDATATIPIILYTAHPHFAAGALESGALEIWVKGTVTATPERLKERVASFFA